MENKDGQVQAPFLPALTLDPNLDFSNEDLSEDNIDDYMFYYN